MSKAWKRIFASLIACSLLALSADNCIDLTSSITKEENALTELLSLKKDLDEKFKSSVAEDMDSQVDDSFDVLTQLKRDNSVKVAYARRKLSRNIDNKRALIDALTAEYCTKCKGLASQKASRKQFCDRCGELEICRRD